MKTYIHAFAMCQSMFCAIPCPWNTWDEKAKDKMLLFLPIVGLEMGAIWTLLHRLCLLLKLPAPAAAIALCAFPYLISGFIHLDGYMDVTDAVGSWRSPERRREILKDSHVGSFAVIGVVMLILAQFALFCCPGAQEKSWILLFVPAVSRCCSALAVTVLKPMPGSQYAGRKKSGGQCAVLILMLAVFLAGGFLLCGKKGWCLPGCVVGFALALRKGYKLLEGMNGDISGYALSLGELWAVAIFTLI